MVGEEFAGEMFSTARKLFVISIKVHRRLSFWRYSNQRSNAPKAQEMHTYSEVIPETNSVIKNNWRFIPYYIVSGKIRYTSQPVYYKFMTFDWFWINLNISLTAFSQGIIPCYRGIKFATLVAQGNTLTIIIYEQGHGRKFRRKDTPGSKVPPSYDIMEIKQEMSTVGHKWICSITSRKLVKQIKATIAAIVCPDFEAEKFPSSNVI